MTARAQRIEDFDKAGIIQRHGVEAITSERLRFLSTKLREYILELDMALLKIEILEAQLNSKQSNNDKEKEDSYNE